MHTNIITQLGNILNRYMKPLFNIRGEGAFAFIMGLISGYPVGAKLLLVSEKTILALKKNVKDYLVLPIIPDLFL